MRVRGRLDWKVGVSVSRGKAAESLGDWVWRLGLAAHVEPAWGAAGSGCWLLAVGCWRTRTESMGKAFEHVL